MNLREWALPVYTILMQLAIGAFFALWMIRSIGRRKFGKDEMDQFISIPLILILFTVITAIIGSHFHLSRPFQSLSAVSNFRTSWLSREIALTILLLFSLLSLITLLHFVKGRELLKATLGWVTALLGILVIFCMSKIYLLESQFAWNSPATIPTFFSTSVLLGVISLTAMMLMDLRFSEEWRPDQLGKRPLIIKQALVWLIAAAAVALFVIYFFNWLQFLLLQKGDSTAQTSLKLLIDLYQPLLVLRLLLPFIGIAWLTIAVLRLRRQDQRPSILLQSAYISCILVTIGEILGRFLFYATHVRIGV
jgi:anaerobic dimethyl sulfoxide reductase subunit C (anchor subunit)